MGPGLAITKDAGFINNPASFLFFRFTISVVNPQSSVIAQNN